MKRFELHRAVDNTGVSGARIVASGVEWPDGTVVMRWRTSTPSTSTTFANMDEVRATCASRDEVRAIHDRVGSTTVFYLDMPATNDVRDWTLEALCTRCFGGPYTADGLGGRGHYCLDCGASHSNVFLPAWAAKDIRDHDRQRLKHSEELGQELRLLRSKMPPPSPLRVSRIEPMEGLNDAKDKEFAASHWRAEMLGASTYVRATTKEEALLEGAKALSWSRYLEEEDDGA